MDGLSSPTTAADGRWPMQQIIFLLFLFPLYFVSSKNEQKTANDLGSEFFFMRCRCRCLGSIGHRSIRLRLIRCGRSWLIFMRRTCSLFSDCSILFGLCSDGIRTVFGVSGQWRGVCWEDMQPSTGSLLSNLKSIISSRPELRIHHVCARVVVSVTANFGWGTRKRRNRKKKKT